MKNKIKATTVLVFSLMVLMVSVITLAATLKGTKNKKVLPKPEYSNDFKLFGNIDSHNKDEWYKVDLDVRGYNKITITITAFKGLETSTLVNIGRFEVNSSIENVQDITDIPETIKNFKIGEVKGWGHIIGKDLVEDEVALSIRTTVLKGENVNFIEIDVSKIDSLGFSYAATNHNSRYLEHLRVDLIK